MFTEEELAMLQQYLQSQFPVTGSPGDKNIPKRDNLLDDQLKSTGRYLQDYVPGLYPEVEDPGRYEGYRADSAGLYQGNPIYQDILDLVDQGVPFDQALSKVQRVLASGGQDAAVADLYEQYAPYAPLTYDETGGESVDFGGLRQGAQTFYEDMSRQNREMGDWQAQQDAYQDYISPRTNLDIVGVPQVEPIRTRVNGDRFLNPTWLNDTQVLGKNFGVTPAPAATGMQRPVRGREPMVTARPGGRQTYDAPVTGEEQRGKMAAITNKARQDAIDAYVAARSKEPAPSKRDANAERVNAAYRLIVMGQ